MSSYVVVVSVIVIIVVVVVTDHLVVRVQQSVGYASVSVSVWTTATTFE